MPGDHKNNQNFREPGLVASPVAKEKLGLFLPEPRWSLHSTDLKPTGNFPQSRKSKSMSWKRNKEDHTSGRQSALLLVETPAKPCVSAAAWIPLLGLFHRKQINRGDKEKEGDSLWIFFFNCLAVIAYLSPPGRKRRKSTSPSLGGPGRKAGWELSKLCGEQGWGRMEGTLGGDCAYVLGGDGERTSRGRKQGSPEKRLGEKPGLGEGHDPWGQINQPGQSAFR